MNSSCVKEYGVCLYDGVSDEQTLRLIFLLIQSLLFPPFPRCGVSVCEDCSPPLHRSLVGQEPLHMKCMWIWAQARLVYMQIEWGGGSRVTLVQFSCYQHGYIKTNYVLLKAP